MSGLWLPPSGNNRNSRRSNATIITEEMLSTPSHVLSQSEDGRPGGSEAVADASATPLRSSVRGVRGVRGRGVRSRNYKRSIAVDESKSSVQITVYQLSTNSPGGAKQRRAREGE